MKDLFQMNQLTDKVCFENYINWVAVVVFTGAAVAIGSGSFFPIGASLLGLFVFVMIVNGCIQFRSSHYQYIENMIEQAELEEYMKILLKTAPKKAVFVDCFHYVSSEKNRRKVSSFSKYFYFDYSSWKDVSSKFELSNAENKDFCRFRLDYKIQLNDSETQKRYEEFVSQLRTTYQNKDREFSLTEVDQLDNLKKFRMIKFKEASSMVSTNMFILAFCTLTIDLYKWYLNAVTSIENFELRKTVSSLQNFQGDANEINSNNNLENQEKNSKTSNLSQNKEKNDCGKPENTPFSPNPPKNHSKAVENKAKNARINEIRSMFVDDLEKGLSGNKEEQIRETESNLKKN